MRMTNAIDTLSSKDVGGHDTGVVAAAAALVPALRVRAAQTDAPPKLPEARIADFERARLFEMVVPKLYSGWHSSLSAYLDPLIEVARGRCSAASAPVILSAGTCRRLAVSPEHASDQLFAPSGRP